MNEKHSNLLLCLVKHVLILHLCYSLSIEADI